MVAMVLDVLSWVLLLAGAAFVVIGAFGMWRLPDFYTRLHPAGLTDTMG
ncbi:MAG: sodium:proton antiporter, partial [Rhodospirillaceae bacterium]|nr:sodium:proton antiporter [Rhodospirillaceae bacterium]